MDRQATGRSQPEGLPPDRRGSSSSHLPAPSPSPGSHKISGSGSRGIDIDRSRLGDAKSSANGWDGDMALPTDSSSSVSSLLGERSFSPMGSYHDFDEGNSLNVSDDHSKRSRVPSPTLSAAAGSPFFSSAQKSQVAIPTASTASSTLATNMQQPFPSLSAHSLYGTSPSKPQSSSMRNSSGDSNHSRHSSSAASGGVPSMFIDATNTTGSKTIGSTSSNSVDNIEGRSQSANRAPSIKGTVSVGSLASALARSNLSDQAALQMVASHSHGSSADGSGHSLGNSHSSSSLSRPPILRQSFSDGSPFSVASSPHHSTLGSHTGSPVPVSLPTTGPLSAADPRTQLHISNLPFRVRWQDVKDLCRKAGTVLRADVSLTADNRSRGFGTVLMATEDDAKRACDMFNGFNWQGRTLDVQIDRSGTLMGVGVSQMVNPASMLGNSYSSPTAAPLGQYGYGFDDGSGSSGINNPASSALNNPPMRLGIQQPAQMQSNISPALYPFLGSSNRTSISGASTSAMQASSPSLSHWSPGGIYNQQRPITTNTGLGGAPLAQAQAQIASPYQQHQHHHQLPAPSFSSPFMPNQTVPMHQQQPQFASPFLAPANAQSLRPSPMQGPSIGMGGNPINQMPGLGGVGMSSPLPPSLPQQPPPNSYYGRVLFVGNLPFHCQWQDLKDLFRAAGHIQRADVALSTEGKSRGFGTVLFATPEDAQNAVRIYHGYEYSGRTLKVHFDRFAQMTAPVSGALPASPSHYTGAFAAANTPSTVAPSSTSQAQQSNPQAASSTSNASRSFDPAAGGGLQSSFAQFLNDTDSSAQSSRGQATAARPESGLAQAQDPSTSSAKGSNMHPGRIILPPQGFTAFQSHNAGNFSPMTTRMSVPMTPGMPGFTFHPLSPTSPIHHPHMLSPGLHGPFSPPLGDPSFGGHATPGASSSAFNPHINHAPGAPIHFSNGLTTPISSIMSAIPSGYNPMFPPVGGSYSQAQQQQIPMQSQQGFHLPQTPHWSQPRQPPAGQTRRQSRVAAAIAEAGPDVNTNQDGAGKENAAVTTNDEEDGEGEKSTEEGGYPFPLVQPSSSILLQRRASTNSPAYSPLPGGPKGKLSQSPGWDLRRGSVASSTSSTGLQDLTQLQASTGAKSTEELARKIAQMSAQKALRQKLAGRRGSTNVVVTNATAVPEDKEEDVDVVPETKNEETE